LTPFFRRHILGCTLYDTYPKWDALMPTGPQNAKSRQVAIRLPHDLDKRIAHYMADTGLTQSQALITLLERGLVGVHDSGIHRDAPECDAPRDTPWDASITALVARVEALEAAVAKPETRRKSKAGEFNPARHYLGELCERGHDWEGSGQSRYSKRNQACMACEAEGAIKRRAAKKAAG
jgi:hypothetical protein